MDLVLRNEDGLAVLRELGELEIHPRVLVLSGFARSNMAELAAAAGADFCLMKPCRMDTVVERVRPDDRPGTWTGRDAPAGSADWRAW